jgi:aminomethyltransferase
MSSNNSATNPMLKNKDNIDHISMNMRRSPFNERIEALNLSETWVDWNGYRTPAYYFDTHIEYMATRNTCGVFDCSPMSKYRIKGKDTERMLNRMVTRDVASQAINTVVYNVWCTDSGRVIDDGTLFRLSDDEFIIFCAEPNMDWFQLSSVGFDDITITDESDNIAGVALQGPTSCAVLKVLNLISVAGKAIEELTPFEISNFVLETQGKKIELMISRTGFTGDLGYELWLDPKHALEFWDALFEAGKLYGIQPFGDDSIALARLEAGFILPDIEFHGALHTVNHGYDQSPLELSLGWMLNFKKGNFNGRAALLEEKKKGSPYKLVKLDIQGNKPAQGSILYSDKACGKEIGYVTSAGWSSALKKNIAYGFIKGNSTKGEIWAEIYYQKELRWQRKVAECTRHIGPFWAPARAKQTPPPNC